MRSVFTYIYMNIDSDKYIFHIYIFVAYCVYHIPHYMFYTVKDKWKSRGLINSNAKDEDTQLQRRRQMTSNLKDEDKLIQLAETTT